MKEICGMPLVKENKELISLEVKKECVANSVNVTWRPSQGRTGKYPLDLATNIYHLKYHLIGDSLPLLFFGSHINLLIHWKHGNNSRF